MRIVLKAMRAMALGGAVGLAAMVAAPAVRAQSAQEAGKKFEFDTVSIRENVDHHGDCQPDATLATPSGIHMTNCPLFVPLVTAYQPATGEPLGFAMGDRIIGIPDWARDVRFDIEAHIGSQDLAAWQDPVQRQQMLRAMMQQMLAERFKLVAHREIREKAAFALVVGKNGPKLKPAVTAVTDAIRTKYPKGLLVPGSGGVVVPGPNGSLELYGATTGLLALALAGDLRQPVVDQTGLTGRYDMSLEMAAGGGEMERASALFALVQDQLGLKLESHKEQVEVLVIDHVEKPSPN